jgi:rubrerythrin
MSTHDNLKAAFAGESQANRKYLAFSRKAADEKLEMVSRLYQAVAAAETIHALKHLQIMNGVGSTLNNLKEALAGEHYEFTEMYPAFIAAAEQEENKQARNGFYLANEAEKVHHKLYEKALLAVQQNQDYPAEGFYLCPVCGYVHENEAPEKCPICGAPGSRFEKF